MIEKTIVHVPAEKQPPGIVSHLACALDVLETQDWLEHVTQLATIKLSAARGAAIRVTSSPSAARVTASHRRFIAFPSAFARLLACMGDSGRRLKHCQYPQSPSETPGTGEKSPKPFRDSRNSVRAPQCLSETLRTRSELPKALPRLSETASELPKALPRLSEMASELPKAFPRLSESLRGFFRAFRGSRKASGEHIEPSETLGRLSGILARLPRLSEGSRGSWLGFRDSRGFSLPVAGVPARRSQGSMDSNRLTIPRPPGSKRRTSCASTKSSPTSRRPAT